MKITIGGSATRACNFIYSVHFNRDTIARVPEYFNEDTKNPSQWNLLH